MQTLTIPNFEHFSLSDVDTLTIKIQELKFLGRMGSFEFEICKSFYHLSKTSGDVLGLAGYTQSSGTGELRPEKAENIRSEYFIVLE